MELSKSEIKAFIACMEGKTDITSLQNALKIEQPRASYLAEQLVEKGFLTKKRQGLKLELEIASTPYAIKFREMYTSLSYLKYPEILSGRNLDVLQAIVYHPKETKTIARMLRVQPRAIRQRLGYLMDFGLIYKIGKKYVLSPSSKEIHIFIDSIRTYMDIKGILYWRLNSEILYATRDEKAAHGHPTGFNEYYKYGVLIHTIKYTCYIGKTKPGMEEIFIHSLYQIEDSRTLGLAITFFAKNKLGKKLEKLKFLAEKYDVQDKLVALIEVFEKYKKGENKIEAKGIFSIDRETIDRQFGLYDV